MKDKDEKDRARSGGDLDSLRAEAADELDQEEAGRRADASAQAYVNSKAARLNFEAQQKDQARADAAEDRARAERDEAAKENYDRLLETEADAKSQADEDARAAGRQTADEQVAADEEAAGNGEGINTGRAYPVQAANEGSDEGRPFTAEGNVPEQNGTTGAAGGEGTWPAGEPDETVAGSAGSEQTAQNGQDEDGGCAGPGEQVTRLPDGQHVTEDDAEPLHFEGTAQVNRRDDGEEL